MDAIDRARRYIAKADAAISGSGGHNATFAVAAALVHGFDLSQSDALRIMAEEFNPRCQPPWSLKDLEHKIASVATAKHSKARGHLLGENGSQRRSAPGPRLAPAAVIKPNYTITEDDLPEELPDGARALIKAVFRPGEGIRIANATLNEEQREIPDGSGTTLNWEDWVKKLDAAGGKPNSIWHSSKRTGIYIGINPMKVGGKADADVIDYRHALLEFDDTLNPGEQLALYRQSKIPCAAVIYSGGKSIHAWVRVDATNREEYDERVKFIYDHFAAYKPDPKNKNPSRFSRLPNCVRFKKRQELLALGMGAESWSEWQRHLSAAEIGPCWRFSDLSDVDTAKDPSCVIGFKDGNTKRYLCKGKSAWLIGASGIGKSTLIAEFATAWALGQPCFGIEPARPLKSLIIQAENDFYDIAEMTQGIAKTMGINREADPDRFGQIDANVLFKNETNCIRNQFCERLRRLIDRDRPDVVWVDPLLSYAGIDVSRQDQCSEFLREWLGPVLESTGVVIIGVHHTGKPKSARETMNWTELDYAYSGIGSSELVNWARAVLSLRPVGDDGNYTLTLAKRGGRAGATHLSGEPTKTIWLRHSKQGLRWIQVDPPEEKPAEDKPAKEPKKTKPEQVATMNLGPFLQGLSKDGLSLRGFCKELMKWLVSKDSPKKLILSEGSARAATELLLANGKTEIRNDLYFKGPNA